MFNQRCRALPEYRKLFLDQIGMVINTLCPVSSHVILDPADHRICRTVQYGHGMDTGDPGDITGLSRVAGNAVQHQHIGSAETNTRQEERYDLFSKNKMLVLEQQSLFQHTVNEVELCFRIRSGAIATRYRTPELRPKIEMMARPFKETLMRDRIAERTFADPGGTEKQDSVNGNKVPVIHARNEAPFSGSPGYSLMRW